MVGRLVKTCVPAPKVSGSNPAVSKQILLHHLEDTWRPSGLPHVHHPTTHAKSIQRSEQASVPPKINEPD